MKYKTNGLSQTQNNEVTNFLNLIWIIETYLKTFSIRIPLRSVTEKKNPSCTIVPGCGKRNKVTNMLPVKFYKYLYLRHN